MQTTFETPAETSSSPTARWRDLVWPREHGSWSLALEPAALGMLVAFSPAGLALGVAILAAFFARRPLRAAFTETRRERRVVARCITVVFACVALMAAAIVTVSSRWSSCVWFIPSLAAGGAFVYFDLRKAGREGVAELCGAAAFAWLPATFAILAGWNAASAAALGAIMLGRALPTVLTIRSALRARKAGERPNVLPIVFAGAAALGGIALVRIDLAPPLAAAALAVLALRSFVLLAFPRPSLRASTMGMIEVAFGIAFVIVVAAAWHR
jgi:hypothetical protein